MPKPTFLLPIAVAAVLAAGCGSGGGGAAKLAKNDIAVVGKTHITVDQYDALLQQARQSYKQQGQKFPKAGTPQFETVKGEAVSLLVQQAEREEKAASMGITVSDKEISDRLAQIKKQYFSNDEKRYQTYLKQQKLTDAVVREDIREQLISQKVFNLVTKNVTVSNSDVHAYYVQNIAQYTQQPSRDVRYILVGKSHATALSVYDQLLHGNTQTWCKLAKKYAKDASGQNCGKATFSKGQTVAVFDRIAFTAPANKVHLPFYDPTQYKAWFVIEPLGPVKKGSVTPEKSVANQIRQQLLQNKRNQTMSDWVSGLSKTFCSGSKIAYQAGYSASPDPCTATTSATTG
ncbi:MAG TPA: SurA N-terminal domain-containing protein [Gaiellaceae bacterium]|nr:SurA N-terminal domain-containing protein [Gaiellaceae bacterium]